MKRANMVSLSNFPITILVIVVSFSCSDPKNEDSEAGHRYELVKADSIQVDYMGTVTSAEFSSGKGILHDNQKGTFVLFDSMGNILSEKTIPEEGPGSLSWVGGMKMYPNGEIYLNTIIGEIGVLDVDLNLKRKVEMPFTLEYRSMRNNARVMDIYNDHLYVFYPGRDGISPYQPHYLKHHHLLEKVSLITEEPVPFLKLPPDSKYRSDLYYDAPSMLVSIHDNLLYHTMSGEPVINVANLDDNEEWLEIIPLEATKFIEVEGRKNPQDPITRVYEGGILGLYPFDAGVVVYYNEGIDQETFLNNDLGEQKNFPLYPYFDKKVLKIHQTGIGWSNEVVVPREVRFFLNITSPEDDIYALRNDEVVGEEQDFITIYKMRLVNLLE